MGFNSAFKGLRLLQQDCYVFLNVVSLLTFIVIINYYNFGNNPSWNENHHLGTGFFCTPWNSISS